MFNAENLKFDEKGLIPAVVVDHYTNTLAYMNRESLGITLEKGLTCFYSRSRNKLWLKGESSGNFQHVVSVTADCDGDALVVEVVKDGPACHTGEESCFHNPVWVSDSLKQFSYPGLYELIKGRKTSPKQGSYTTYLFDKGIEETVFEISDLLYHLTVLMVEMGISLPDVAKELEKRHVVDTKVKQETMR